ncbi:MAG: SDR family oxidoreductase [Nannocystaceae bacterium]
MPSTVPTVSPAPAGRYANPALGTPSGRPVALVSGGAIRVGRAICDELASTGYDVWIHFRRSDEAAASLARMLGSRCLGTVAADLSRTADRQRLVDHVCRASGPRSGRLDLLVNNAASFESGAFLARNDEDLRGVLEINLIAPLALCRGFARALGDARGVILNIADVAALQPWPRYLDHCTAKAGLVMATRALALELAPTVRVNAVAPGTVAWPTENYAPDSRDRQNVLKAIPLQRIGEAGDIARAVRFLAGATYITGQTLAVDGGVSIAPPRGRWAG